MNSEKKTKLREQLEQEELRLKEQLDQETIDLEMQVSQSLKALGVVSLALVAGYTAFRLMTPATPKVVKPKKTQKLGLVSQSLITAAVGKLIPIALNKINQITSTQRDEHTESTGTK
ncbi:hypothetical protein BFP72_15300 [Reichenbachiella sp. 5M10]|uniref:hypothetical protein n=1 Tax=Reichenbachiella sp. 5M10 TaxID=1889772 RepID=UPI000C1463B1|nr:hypothetical protein [Reichenbachiella sp. 5M10]PIB36671.1 hypothetical protein BFP72_15300 [Reichenbachiella sp. 5M10]